MGKKRVAQKAGNQIIQTQTQDVLKKGGALKALKNIKEGRIYISSSYNNTKIALADEKGNVLLWCSAGKLGFDGTKKGTPFAATKVAEFIAEVAKNSGIASYQVYIKGIGAGRDAALRALAVKGLNIVLLKDITPIPHNGPRPPKVRRV